MKHSVRIQNMIFPYGYEVTKTFLQTFDIFFQVEGAGYIPKDSCMGFRHNGYSYEYKNPNTLYFYTEKDNPYGPNCLVITFADTEDQIVNKFERFIRLKAFL